MEENKNLELEQAALEEEKSSFNFQAVYRTVILNWYWFVLSLLICLGLSMLYLRYATPTYQAFAKMLIKDNDGNGGNRRGMMNMADFGMVSNSTGIDNEMEILQSHNFGYPDRRS